MIRLAEAADGTLHSLLPPSRDAAAWHAALVREIAQHLSPVHAAVLARPELIAGGMAWVVEGAARSRYAELPAEGRRALDAALGAILSDVRRLAESGAAPVVREAWPGLREVPGMGHVFAVDGRPVLAAWGHAGSGIGMVGRLARLDDGVPWRATPQPPWSRYGAALGVLAVLALASGLLLPLASSWFVEKAAACTIVPGQLDAWRGQMEMDGRGQELRTLLATLTEEVGRRELLCPVTVLPPPPPRADLPQDRWEQRDLGLLEGCWSLAMDLSAGRDRASMVKIRSWRLCFGGHGDGQQAQALEDGRSCDGPLVAAFDQQDLLHVTEPAACSGPTLHMSRSELLCRRRSNSEALCQGRNFEGALATSDFSGRFRR